MGEVRSNVPDKAGRTWHGDGIYSKANADGQVWYYVRFADGRRRHVQKAGKTLGQARRVLAQRHAEVRLNQYVDPREAKRHGISFRDFAAEFLKQHPGKRRSNHYPVNVGELVRHFGNRGLADITRADLDAYRLAMQTTSRPGRKLGKRLAAKLNRDRAVLPPLSSTTILKRLRVLHRMFRLAVRWGYLPVNPATDLEKPAPAKGRLRWLSPDEFARLERESPPWLRPVQRLAVATGMREKEITNLTWGLVDFPARLIHVPMDSKTGTRVVPMSETARQLLEGLRDRRKATAREVGIVSAFVFVDDAGQDYTSDQRRSTISETTRKVAARIGLGDGVGFHVLRHTFASWAVQAGVSLFEVQKILGHSDPKLTMIYAHLAPQHLQAAPAAVDRALGTKLGDHMATGGRDAEASPVLAAVSR